MWKALSLPLAGFAISLLAAQDSRGQTPVTETIALTFEQIPEGERLLRSLGLPAIDADGSVVFGAHVSLPSFITTSSLVLKSTGAGTELTRIPDIAPGFTIDPKDPVFFLFPSGPMVNSGGTVAFTSAVKAETGSPRVSVAAVLFTGNSLNDLKTVARSDELLDVVQPDAPETVTLGIGEFVLNESGAAAFIVTWGGTGQPARWAVFVPGENGGFVAIVRSGRQAPGTSSGTVFIFSSGWS